jgi:hypothetical protein
MTDFVTSCTFLRCSASGKIGGCCFINSNGFTINECCFRECYAKDGQVLYAEGLNVPDIQRCSSYVCGSIDASNGGYGVFDFNRQGQFRVLYSNFTSCSSTVERGDGAVSMVRGSTLGECHFFTAQCTRIRAVQDFGHCDGLV